MQMSAPRLLISARDPGAAQEMAVVAHRGRARGDLEIHLVADEPALGMLRAEGLHVAAACAPTAQDLSEAARLLSAARDILDEYRPNAVLTGLSGPEAGIDEGLLAVCSDRPTYAVQNFWGDVNRVLERPAGLYFVLDSEAAALTQALHLASAQVTGSPKYAAFAALDPLGLRKLERARCGFGPNDAVIGFFGQPLWHIDGYAEAFSALVRAASRVQRTHVVFRPHPKDTREDGERARRILKRAGITFSFDGNTPISALLATCDIVCTAYSSCGFDAIMLGRVASAPLGVVVYVMTPALCEHYKSATGLDRLPPVSQGLAFEARHEETLTDQLERALRPETQLNLWRLARRVVPEPVSAADRILDRILLDLSMPDSRSMAVGSPR